MAIGKRKVEGDPLYHAKFFPKSRLAGLRCEFIGQSIKVSRQEGRESAESNSLSKLESRGNSQADRRCVLHPELLVGLHDEQFIGVLRCIGCREHEVDQVITVGLSHLKHG